MPLDRFDRLRSSGETCATIAGRFGGDECEAPLRGRGIRNAEDWSVRWPDRAMAVSFIVESIEPGRCCRISGVALVSRAGSSRRKARPARSTPAMLGVVGR